MDYIVKLLTSTILQSQMNEPVHFIVVFEFQIRCFSKCLDVITLTSVKVHAFACAMHQHTECPVKAALHDAQIHRIEPVPTLGTK